MIHVTTMNIHQALSVSVGPDTELEGSGARTRKVRIDGDGWVHEITLFGADGLGVQLTPAPNQFQVTLVRVGRAICKACPEHYMCRQLRDGGCCPDARPQAIAATIAALDDVQAVRDTVIHWVVEGRDGTWNYDLIWDLVLVAQTLGVDTDAEKELRATIGRREYRDAARMLRCLIEPHLGPTIEGVRREG